MERPLGRGHGAGPHRRRCHFDTLTWHIQSGCCEAQGSPVGCHPLSSPQIHRRPCDQSTLSDERQLLMLDICTLWSLRKKLDMSRTGDPTESMPVLDDPECSLIRGPVFTGRHNS